MLRRIKVYGRLRKFLGGTSVFEADVANPAEAVSFLVANWPKLEAHMAKQYYKVFVGNYNVGKDELHDPSSVQEEIKIVPVVVGAGDFADSAFGKIVIGVILIAAPYAIPALAAGTGFGAFVGSTMTTIGVSLVVAGVSQMLNPTPDDGVDDSDAQQNYSFNGVQNVSRVVPIPICYGEMIVGSVIVSAGIDTVQVKGVT
jgi:predicted phage tail protein